MPKPLPIYLHTFRKRSGLSQRELAFLLRTSSAMLSKLERLERRPTASVVIGAEIIFGASSYDVFPSFYEQVEAKVMQQAAILYERLETRRNEKSKEKCRLLLDMIQRVPPLNADV
jgi:transcriptional regulator with XRE-family HTH domain